LDANRIRIAAWLVAQIDRAVLAEGADELPGFGVEFLEVITGGEDQPAVATIRIEIRMIALASRVARVLGPNSELPVIIWYATMLKSLIRSIDYAVASIGISV